jgi:hypothetical protein
MLLQSNNDTGLGELTTTWFKLLGASIAVMLMAREAAPAELPPGQALADWMQSYGEHNKDCLEWTNTCVNCVRDQSSKNFSCSNIGIACQRGSVSRSSGREKVSERVVEKLSKFQSCSVRNVSQLATSPDFKPVVNHRERCAEVPWVKASGTT